VAVIEGIPLSSPDVRYNRLRRGGYWLEGASMTWTLVVVAVAVTAGVIETSIALIGLGIDSGLDVVAAGIVIWQLHADEIRHGRALRLIALTFLLGAAFLFAESIHDLTMEVRSDPTTAALAVAAAALLVMPLLAAVKRRIGRALDSHALIADSTETALCGVAGAAALLGIGLDYWLGVWWTVPAAGLAIGILASREAVRTWRRREN
jgi:divalent metal cation (Fe/Co/Zn/Cd) transporter